MFDNPIDESCDDGVINSVIDMDSLIIEIKKGPAIYNKRVFGAFLYYYFYLM